MCESLHFSEKESELAFTTKPTSKELLTFGITVKTFRTAVRLLGTGAGFKLEHASLISTGCEHRTWRHGLPRLRKATRQPPS